MIGLTSPGRVGADVCHLNLHKTFGMHVPLPSSRGYADG